MMQHSPPELRSVNTFSLLTDDPLQRHGTCGPFSAPRLHARPVLFGDPVAAADVAPWVQSELRRAAVVVFNMPLPLPGAMKQVLSITKPSKAGNSIRIITN